MAINLEDGSVSVPVARSGSEADTAAAVLYMLTFKLLLLIPLAKGLWHFEGMGGLSRRGEFYS